MSVVQRRDRLSGIRVDAIVIASLWTLVAILLTGIAIVPAFGAGVC